MDAGLARTMIVPWPDDLPRTVMLSAVLEIKAYLTPTPVSTDDGHYLDRVTRAVSTFNHVILRATCTN